jgi:hypothetical protein
VIKVALAVCLLLDRRTERAIRGLWDQLESVGVPSLRSHTYGRHVPHLSYAVLRTWDLTEVTAALAAAANQAPRGARLSESEIRQIIAALGDLTAVIKDADPQDKARIYAGLNLRLTYQPAKRIVRTEVNRDSHGYGAMGCVRGGT